MSNETNQIDLDLHFLPAWAQQSAEVNRYADYEGDTRAGADRRRGDRPPFRGRPDAPRRDGPRPEGRPLEGRREGRPDRRPDRPGRPGWQGRGGPGRGDPRERRESPPPLPEVEVNIVPEEHGVAGLARQIKLTGRAYPLFDIAQLILKKPDRYNVRFAAIKKAEGQVAQPLFLCSLDDTLWLSESQAADHVLRRHFDTFYQTDKIPADAPKGVFTFVAQCGISGVILGPPNYHDYQTKLRRLHAERFANMPFEAYRARVRIVRDEAVVKQWLEEQSFRLEYVCLNVPDPLKLSSREEVEKHFRETHLSNVVQQVDSHMMNGVAARSLPSGPMQALVRAAYEDQRRFPLRLATVLSQMFAAEGLQFFKVNKAVTHVSVARPRHLDITSAPVSDGIKRIMIFILEHPGCNRRQLIETLAPPPPLPIVPPTPPPMPCLETPAPAQPVGAGTAEEAQPAEAAPAAPSAEPASAQGQGAEPAAAGPGAGEPQPTEEMKAVIGDLHWLVHQGHVIEFANGSLETAKPAPPPPPPRPPRPSPPRKADATAAPADAAAAAAPVAGETAPPAAEPALTAPPEPPVESPAAPEAVAPPSPPEAEAASTAVPETGPLPADEQPAAAQPPPAEPPPPTP